MAQTPSRGDLDYLNTLSPFGGNESRSPESYADEGWQKQYDARRGLGYDEAEARRYADEWLGTASAQNGGRAGAGSMYARNALGTGLATSGIADSINAWAGYGQDALDMQRGSSAGIDRARQQGLDSRAYQLWGLNQIENHRANPAEHAATAARNDLMRQAMSAQSRAVPPALALTATAQAQSDLGRKMAGAQAAQGMSRHAALSEGAYGARAQDLTRAALEQQTLDGDLAWQAAKEDLYYKNIDQATQQIRRARGAEIELGKIAAGGPADFDWGEALLPGLTQMASLGLMGLGNMGGGGGSIAAGSPASAATIAAAPGGNAPAAAFGAGAAQGVNDYLARYGY